MQTREERTVARAIRDRVKEEYGMTMGESDRWAAWVDLWNLDEREPSRVSSFSSANPIRSFTTRRVT